MHHLLGGHVIARTYSIMTSLLQCILMSSYPSCCQGQVSGNPNCYQEQFLIIQVVVKDKFLVI